MKQSGKEPKFKIGDTVTGVSKYGERMTGKVKEVRRTFAEWKDGKFNEDGLHICESTFDSISHPKTFDGETLVIEAVPEYWMPKREYKFHNWSYTFRAQTEFRGEKMDVTVVFPEHALKQIS